MPSEFTVEFDWQRDTANKNRLKEKGVEAKHKIGTLYLTKGELDGIGEGAEVEVTVKVTKATS